jgi:hypothetical protein
LAAATAVSTSCSVPAGTVVSSCSVDGSTTDRVSLPEAGTHAPPMKNASLACTGDLRE